MAIRLRYTGLLMFASSVLSLFTGLVFSSFVARGLSKFDYGAWAFISTTVAYFQFSQKLITSWAFRDMARGRSVGRTCVISELLLSIPSFLAYLIAAPYFSQTVGSPASHFYLSSLLIPIYFMIQGLETVIRATSPHKLAYRNVILDSMKMCLILWLIRFGLIGFIVTVMAAHVGYICYCLCVTRGSMRGGFDPRSLRRWLSFSWVSLYSQVGSTMSSGLGTLLLGILTTPSALGSWSVALAVARLLRMPSALSSALYPKLLSDEGRRDAYIRDSVMLTLMFLVPMAVGCYLLAPNLIEVYGSKYLDGLPALYVLIPNYFIYVIGTISGYAILAADKTDMEKHLSASKWLRSDVFLLRSLNYLDAAVSAPLMLVLIPKYGMIGCATAVMAATMVAFLIKSMKFNVLKLISYKRLAKFLLSSLIMGIFILLVYGHGTIKTLLIVVTGAAVYLTSLVAFDRETRALSNRIFNEMKKILYRKVH